MPFAQADKMLDLRERLQKALKEQSKSGERVPARDVRRSADARKAYEKELQRISAIPGAAQALRAFIAKMKPDFKGMKPDAQSTAARSSAIERALAEREKEALKTFDPHPDPSFKGNIANVFVPAEKLEWFPSAMKGDFVEYVDDSGRPERFEVLAVEGGSAVVAHVYLTLAVRSEDRFRMKLGPEAVPMPGLPDLKLSGTETIALGDRALVCQVKKLGSLTKWFCQDVPFDGLVKEETPHGQKRLVDFGRGTGPSPDVSSALAERRRKAAATPSTPGVREVQPGFWEKKWFPSAKKGDFVQYESVHKSDPRVDFRREVIEVTWDSAVVAETNKDSRGSLEQRVRMRADPVPDRYRPPVERSLGTETITVAGRALVCRKTKRENQVTCWACDEVPFDGLVKEVHPNGIVRQLVDFGRGTGPSPEGVVPSTVDAGGTALSASPLVPQSQAPPAVRKPSKATRSSSPAADATQTTQDLQASINSCEQEIDRLNADLNQALSTAKDLEKKLERLAIASSKSKRAKDSKSEFQRQLSHTRAEISKLERELKKREDEVAKHKKVLDSLQPLTTQDPTP
jgi:hypothetical protein